MNQLTQNPVKLTAKQERFCREYVIDSNGKRAAMRAGYSENTAESQASRLLTNVKVSTRVKELTDNVANDLGITHYYVLKTTKEMTERCRQAYPVLDKEGNQIMVETPKGELVPAFMFDSKGVAKGLELMGKHIGTFDGDKQENNDTPQWTGIEIDYGDGKLKVVHGTGQIPQNLNQDKKEGPPEIES